MKNQPKKMTMDILVKQSLEAASKITGKTINNTETQKVAFHLACVAMAVESSK